MAVVTTSPVSASPFLKRSMIASRVGVVAAERDDVVVVEVDAVGAELGELLQRVHRVHRRPGRAAEGVDALPADGPQPEGELVLGGGGGDLDAHGGAFQWGVGGFRSRSRCGSRSSAYRSRTSGWGSASSSSAPRARPGRRLGGRRPAPTPPGARRRGRRTPPAAARDGPAQDRRGQRAHGGAAGGAADEQQPAALLGDLRREQVDRVGERAEQRLVRRTREVGACRGRPEPGPGAGGLRPVGGPLAAVVGQEGQAVGAGRCAQGEGGELVVVDAQQRGLEVEDARRRSWW